VNINEKIIQKLVEIAWVTGAAIPYWVIDYRMQGDLISFHYWLEKESCQTNDYEDNYKNAKKNCKR
jgi:hypothetical protein